MVFKVFYAWQQDRPNNLCRSLIRRALDKAVTNLKGDLEIEDALRDVEIDQDTQGVAGSPSVAETILRKIRECDAFVSDLTIIPKGEGGRTTPNPNVLVEYGYALHALGDQRIIGVFNEAFGEPSDLPFDLRHKRWPIRYGADDDSDSEEARARRRQARTELAAVLTSAIRDIIQTFAQAEEASPTPSDAAASQVIAELPATTTLARPAQLNPHLSTSRSLPAIVDQSPWDHGLVGILDNTGSTTASREVKLLDGPGLFLRLKSRNLGTNLSNVQTMEIVRSALQPVAARRADGWSYVRNRHGGAAYTFAQEDPNTAFAASILTRSGEIHGIDCYHLQAHRFREEFENPFIPTGAIEEILIDSLANYLNVANEHLHLTPPLEVAVGLEDVENYCLAVDRKYFDFSEFAGHIFSRTIGKTIIINEYDCDLFEMLLPFFSEIYDSAGLVRPDVRTTGRSQR